MIFLSKKFSDSTSNLCLVTLAILSQWRSFIALLAINSRSGQHSLKSSIFFFNSLNACHSLRALGSLRHLSKQHQMIFINVLIIVIILIVIIITVIIMTVIKIIIIITITNIIQRAKKVGSDSPWLVDFAIGLVIFVLNLPDGQVLFFGEI